MSSRKKLHRQVDKVDAAIVKKLAQRQSLVEQIIHQKGKNGQNIRDAQHESRKMSQIEKIARRSGLSPYFVKNIFKNQFYRLASRLNKKENTIVKVGDVAIGGGNFVIIAGPCSVESDKQILKTARWLKKHGTHILRGGIFKQRTSPYSFQGLGLEGLDYLYRAKMEFGLPIVTEVLTPAQVTDLLPKVDMLQIGARNMQNFALLNEVGQVNKPVLLKRGMMASLDEFLAAAEYILSKGNQQVVLCERGIRTFETATRNTLDLSAIPVLKERTHLPIIVDPSHATGCQRWVTPLARAALACGADGIMVEVHPAPAEALSDAEQALNFEEFGKMVNELNKLSSAL